MTHFHKPAEHSAFVVVMGYNYNLCMMPGKRHYPKGTFTCSSSVASYPSLIQQKRALEMSGFVGGFGLGPQEDTWG